MSTSKKKLKGKTITFFTRLERENGGESWAAMAYCPWCSVKKEVEGMASETRAVNRCFESIETHWNIEHK